MPPTALMMPAMTPHPDTERLRYEATNKMTNEQKAQAWFDEWAKKFSDLREHPAWRKGGMVDFAAFCLDKSSILPEALEEQWASLNQTLLVNFLRLPEEHQVHLMESILVKRPKLKELMKP
jgi:hypothetical protein